MNRGFHPSGTEQEEQQDMVVHVMLSCVVWRGLVELVYCQWAPIL